MSATRKRWRLVWRDEFDGDAIDPAKWDFDIGNGFHDARTHAWVPGWGNDELQYYTRDHTNAFVRDSVLHIRALQEPRFGCAYTSARLKTCRPDGTPLFAKRYGRFEFRARAPHGKGLWPALWLLPQEQKYGTWAASGEIDVMEIRGDQPRTVLGALHFGSRFPKCAVASHTLALPDGDVAAWHVYGVEWEPGEIRWSLDRAVWARQDFWWSCSLTRDDQGVEPARASDLNPWPAPFDQPFHLVMNLAVGGTFPGLPDAATPFPAELQVDYVRVYDKVGGYGKPAPRGTGPLPAAAARND